MPLKRGRLQRLLYIILQERPQHGNDFGLALDLTYCCVAGNCIDLIQVTATPLVATGSLASLNDASVASKPELHVAA